MIAWISYMDNNAIIELDFSIIISNYWMRLSMTLRIMQIDGPTAKVANTVQDLHNSSGHSKAAFNNRFIVYSFKIIHTLKTS